MNDPQLIEALRRSLFGFRVLWVQAGSELHRYQVNITRIILDDAGTPQVLIDDKNVSWNWKHIICVNQHEEHMG